jgi:hypothetical protein
VKTPPASAKPSRENEILEAAKISAGKDEQQTNTQNKSKPKHCWRRWKMNIFRNKNSRSYAIKREKPKSLQ